MFEIFDNNILYNFRQLLPATIHIFKVFDKDLEDEAPGDNIPTDFFTHTLSETELARQAKQIAIYLKGSNETDFVFFHPYSSLNKENEWLFNSAKVNLFHKRNYCEVVITSFDLGIMTTEKKALYTVLNDYGFFKMNLNKVNFLSLREKVIIRLLAKGMTSMEIASAQHISVHTVNTHRKNINKKLNIKSTAALLRFAEVFEFN